ncbi:hypothetical protein [Thalassobius sp. Cn5-15]|uniref:hypothetical protein n=1 Tax=Thalassobius sp. Cn5-15 TaxID=2917763 RepID=UPI001EF188DA|nr:hypothetical protein [Thalassobius sp. Cn5-15]
MLSGLMLRMKCVVVEVSQMIMRVLAVLSLVGVVACSPTADLAEKPVPLGDFSFGHNVVIAKDPVKGPLSRGATEEEWVGALETAIGTRFDQYEGDRLYHFGVAVQGYVLAQPGIPVVASPKSVLIINLDVWDDAKGVKLNAEPKQITALERISGETFVGSGLTQSKEQQMKNLSENAARLIKVYLESQHKEEGWFVPEAAAQSEQASEADSAATAERADVIDQTVPLSSEPAAAEGELTPAAAL